MIQTVNDRFEHNFSELSPVSILGKVLIHRDRDSLAIVWNHNKANVNARVMINEVIITPKSVLRRLNRGLLKFVPVHGRITKMGLKFANLWRITSVDFTKFGTTLLIGYGRDFRFCAVCSATGAIDK
ncbi:MAG: hypothetical protein Q4C95_11740 [Planctomycetia bacterium]|nr:hypothetical protein [Planctomycetia bacterium]